MLSRPIHDQLLILLWIKTPRSPPKYQHTFDILRSRSPQKIIRSWFVTPSFEFLPEKRDELNTISTTAGMTPQRQIPQSSNPFLRPQTARNHHQMTRIKLCTAERIRFDHPFYYFSICHAWRCAFLRSFVMHMSTRSPLHPLQRFVISYGLGRLYTTNQGVSVPCPWTNLNCFLSSGQYN